jgi:hypothetical protein
MADASADVKNTVSSTHLQMVVKILEFGERFLEIADGHAVL